MHLLTRVKICGLCRPDDARLAASAGADYLGVILAPGGRRTQSEANAARIWSAAPGVARVGVFVDPDPAEAIDLGERLGLSVLQLHGDEGPEVVSRLRAAGPWRIWKAIRPRTGDAFAEAAAAWNGRVDGLLVDGYSAVAAGGTGTRFPWDEVAARRSAVTAGTELIVAGGLRPDNVAEAVRLLSPDVVDVSSGVESAVCMKSEERVRAFMTAAREAPQEAGRDG